MALDVDNLYAKYQGQTLDYDGVAVDAGQCVQWVEYALTDTQYGYGLQPFWGNAIDWWNNYGGSLTAFDKITDGSIKKGDIVVFNTLVGSQYGHIDIALQDGSTADFIGADSNWNGNKTVHQVHHIGTQYILGSLRLKGEDMYLPNKDEVNAIYIACCGRSATTSEVTNYSQHPIQTCFLEVFNSLEGVAWGEKSRAAVAAGGATYVPYNGVALFTKK